MTQPRLSLSRFPLCCFVTGSFVLTTFARLTFDVYYAAVASLVRLLALTALRHLLATVSTIAFIVLDTTIAMLLLLDLSNPGGEFQWWLRL